MKVVQIPTLTTERANFNFNYITLKFKSSITEENFLLAQSSTPIKSRYQKFDFLYTLSHLSLFFILLSYYLVSYSSGQNSSLIFQVVLIGFLIVANLVLLILAFFTQIFSIHKVDLFEINYFVSSVVLVLNSDSFQDIAFDTEKNLLISTLAICVLILFSSQAQPRNFRVLLVLNAIICAFHGAVTLKNSNLGKVVVVNVVLFIACAYMIAVCYLKELKNRESWVESQAGFVKDLDNGKSSLEDNDGTLNLNDCIEVLMEVSAKLKDDGKESVRRVIGALRCMADNKNYSDFDEMDEEMDEEDRAYIIQSCLPNKISEPTKQKKFRQRGSLENIVEKMLGPEVIVILKQISNTWSIDMFSFNERTGNIPITIIGRYCMKLYNLCDTLDISEIKLTFFLNELGDNYKKNPYHNAIHAADVLSSGLYLIKNSEMFSSLLDIEMLIVILSHLAHDVGHPGLNNRFLINFKDELAIRYNDISVLENFHASITFNILKVADKDISENLSDAQFIKVRKWVIELILATDMSKHFDLIGTMKAKSCKLKDVESPEVRLETLKLLIHAADIGHSAKETALHKKWSKLLSEEFFRQGDIEKEAQKPVSMYCDRETTILSKSQIGFLKNIALPLFEVVASALNSASVQQNCVDQLKTNIASWEFEYSAGRLQTLKMTEGLKLSNDMNSPSGVLQFKSMVFATKN